MEKPKPGQVWVNRGFETAYKTRFFCCVVRVLEVKENSVFVRSLADTGDGRFAFGGPDIGQTFELRIDKDFKTGRFRKFTKEDFDKFKNSRIVNRILYGKT